MKKSYLLIFIFALLVFIMPASFRPNGPAKRLEPEQKKTETLYDQEEMFYDVQLGGVKLGSAIFRQMADGSMIFETNVANFHDTEIIYSQPETLLPLKIERRIKNWLGREKIVEEYDQKKQTVTITKYAGNKKIVDVIEKDGPIQNAILLPHYVRRRPGLKLGFSLDVNLPLRSFKVKLASVEEIKVPAGVFEAYHFNSLPRQIEIWISKDERRIPLKLQGIGVFNYVLVLREYKRTKEDARE